MYYSLPPVRVGWIASHGQIICERIQPHINDVFGIVRHWYAPTNFIV